MPGKPFQSSLIPYQNEIADLRSHRPPVSYARIADLLWQRYGLRIQRAAIAKFGSAGGAACRSWLPSAAKA